MRRGTTTLEVALTLPILLTLLLAVVDGGWWLHEWLYGTLAAQRGARLAAGIRRDAAPEEVAAAAARAWLDHRGMADAVVAVRLSTDPVHPVLAVRVQVPFVPLVGLFPTPPTVSAEATADWYGNIGEGG